PNDEKDSSSISIPFKKVGTTKNNTFNLWDNLFLSSIINSPRMLVDGYQNHLLFRIKCCTDEDWEWHFVDHHISHAASAYLPSPFSTAAIMTLDGRGEVATTTYNIGEGNNIIRLSEVKMPHSFGLLYERLTSYLGFLHSSDE